MASVTHEDHYTSRTNKRLALLFDGGPTENSVKPWVGNNERRDRHKICYESIIDQLSASGLLLP